MLLTWQHLPPNTATTYNHTPSFQSLTFFLTSEQHILRSEKYEDQSPKETKDNMTKLTTSIILLSVAALLQCAPPSLALSSEITSESEESQLAALASRELSSDSLCMLCEGGVDKLLWPLSVIESDGTTCTGKALDMALKYRSGTGGCNAQIGKFRETCCSGVPPKQVDVVPSPDPTDVKVIGRHPVCPVCRGGDYPSETSMVLSVLYLGSGSCAQFDKAGRQGLISAHMCDPLQYFGHEPCGCGEFNQNLNKPAPTQRAYIAPKPTPTPNSNLRGPPPTPIPTKQPTPNPTRNPTPRPTNKFVPAPTKAPVNPSPPGGYGIVTSGNTLSGMFSSTTTSSSSSSSSGGITTTITVSNANGNEKGNNSGSTLSGIWDGTKITTTTTAATATRSTPDVDGKENLSIRDDNRGGAGGRVRRKLKGT